MPKGRAIKSKKQWRKLWARVDRGEISADMVRALIRESPPYKQLARYEGVSMASRKKKTKRSKRRSFNGLKRTCIRYKKVLVRTAAGTREGLRCITYADPGKVGKNPCGDARLKTKRGQDVYGRSPGLMRTKNDQCVRGQ